MKYLGNWSCTVYVWVVMMGRRLGWFVFQVSEGLYCHSKGKWMYFPAGLVLRVLRAISVSCSDKGSWDPSQVPWTCVVGPQFSVHAGKPRTEVAWTVNLLSEGWRGEMLPSWPFGDEHKGTRVNPSVPYKRHLQWIRIEDTRRKRRYVQERCLSWSFRASSGWCHHHRCLWHAGGRQLSRFVSCCSYQGGVGLSHSLSVFHLWETLSFWLQALHNGVPTHGWEHHVRHKPRVRSKLK